MPRAVGGDGSVTASWQGECAHATLDTPRVVAQVRLSGREPVVPQHEPYVLEAGSLVVEDAGERAAQIVRSQIRDADGDTAAVHDSRQPVRGDADGEEPAPHRLAHAGRAKAATRTRRAGRRSAEGH